MSLERYIAKGKQIQRRIENLASDPTIRSAVSAVLLGSAVSACGADYNVGRENTGSKSEALTWDQAGNIDSNVGPTCESTSSTSGFRLWSTNRLKADPNDTNPEINPLLNPNINPGNFSIVASSYNIAGGEKVFNSPRFLHTIDANPINTSYSQWATAYGVGGWCGTGKIVIETEDAVSHYLKSADIDTSVFPFEVSNLTTLPSTISPSGPIGVIDPEINSDCSLLIFADNKNDGVGGSWDLQWTIPGEWVRRQVVGTNVQTTSAEYSPFFCGSPSDPDSKLCFSSNRPVQSLDKKGDLYMGTVDYDPVGKTLTLTNVHNMTPDDYDGNTAENESGGCVENDGTMVYGRQDQATSDVKLIEHQLYTVSDAGVDAEVDAQPDADQDAGTGGTAGSGGTGGFGGTGGMGGSAGEAGSGGLGGSAGEAGAAGIGGSAGAEQDAGTDADQDSGPDSDVQETGTDAKVDAEQDAKPDSEVDSGEENPLAPCWAKVDDLNSSTTCKFSCDENANLNIEVPGKSTCTALVYPGQPFNDAVSALFICENSSNKTYTGQLDSGNNINTDTGNYNFVLNCYPDPRNSGIIFPGNMAGASLGISDDVNPSMGTNSLDFNPGLAPQGNNPTIDTGIKTHYTWSTPADLNPNIPDGIVDWKRLHMESDSSPMFLTVTSPGGKAYLSAKQVNANDTVDIPIAAVKALDEGINPSTPGESGDGGGCSTAGAVSSNTREALYALGGFIGLLFAASRRRR